MKNNVLFNLLTLFCFIFIFSACEEHDSLPLVVKTVMVSPAQDHGVVFKGEEGVLNYNIAIWGENIFPVNLLSKNAALRFFDAQGKEMPSVNGITMSRNTPTVKASGQPSSLKISVNVPDEGAYRLAVVVHGVESNKFTLSVSGKTISDLLGTVTISGTADVGQTLTANLSGFPSDKTPFFIWQKAQYGVPNAVYENISGANESAYVVREADRGCTIRVIVGANGIDGFIQSAPTAAVPNFITGTVVITGSFSIGQTLTANISGLSGDGAPSFTWQRGTGTEFETITGAASSTYLLQAEDVGKVIRVIVKRTGSSGELTSDPTPEIVMSVAAQINALRTITPLPAEAAITLWYTGEQIAPQSLSFGGSSIEITLKANAQNGYLALSNNGAMFTVGNNVTLLLENIELRGRAYNNSAVVVVESGGTLIMNTAAIITGNTNNNSTNSLQGGGVRVAADGVLTMNDGDITANTASIYGGGVLILPNSTFNMNGGNIGLNNSSVGGGISNYGEFNMEGGKIFDNTSSKDGGGIANAGTGDFTMNNGEISGNTAAWEGGGIVNASTGNFIMNNGKISDNKAMLDGGGVSNWTVFDMNDGEISGNTSMKGGGGVYNYNGIFNMYNGVIMSNDSVQGGGVLNNDGGTFNMYNGKISDNFGRYGGGVSNWGYFTMNDGSISLNNATLGGGVENGYTGTLDMEGGEISDNIASEEAGGVFNEGIFILNNGKIINNTASFEGGGICNTETLTIYNGIISGNTSFRDGGGVANVGTFNMENGAIDDNSGRRGGGVYNYNGIFNMQNGVISNNEASIDGGGVAVMNDSSLFNMYNGEISGNTSGRWGGGVIVYGGTNGTAVFNMRNGLISSNAAVEWGGGITNISGIFRISNGIVYGSDAASGANSSATGASFINATMTVTPVSEYGTFINDNFTSNGVIRSLNVTLEVLNGELIRPVSSPSPSLNLFVNPDFSIWY